MFSKIPSKQQVAETPTHKTTTNTKKKRRDSLYEAQVKPPNDTGVVRTYSYAQISQHNTATDLWMVIHGNVYDVTSVLDSHPGGAEVLLDCGGMDATIAFDEVGHSRDSVLMLDPLFLGIVDEDGAMDSAFIGGFSLNATDVPRRGSVSPAEFEYITGHGDGDGAIKNSKTGKVENVSLGESEYFKRIRQRRKKKTIKDEHLVALMAVLALLAAVAYVLLERRKWDEYD